MPVGPASRAYRFVCFVSGFNGHVGHQTLPLPFCQTSTNNPFDLTFAFKIWFRDTREEGLLPLLVQSIFLGPLNTVETLLEDVGWERYEIMLLPPTEPIPISAVRETVVTSYRLDRRTVCLSVEGVYDIAILYGARRRLRHVRLRNTREDLNQETLGLVVGCQPCDDIPVVANHPIWC